MVRLVARDRNQQIMWIKGETKNSPLTYREWFEGKDMQTGWITCGKYRFDPPYTLREEEDE